MNFLKIILLGMFYLEKPMYIMICHWDLWSSGNLRIIVFCKYQLRPHDIAEYQSYTAPENSQPSPSFSLFPLFCLRSFYPSTVCYISSPSLSESLFLLSSLILYGNLIIWQETSRFLWYLNTSRTGLLNCLNARSRGINFRHRASSI